MQRSVTALLLLLVLGGCSTLIISRGSERFIVMFDPGAELSPVFDELRAAGVQILDRLDIISGISCYLTEEQMELVQALSAVRYIELDLKLFMLETQPPRPLFLRDCQMAPAREIVDWGVKRISAPEAWGTATGEGVRIGVIDTGIAVGHPDLQGAVVGGFNAVDGGSYADDNSHGTYVASVLAARKNGVGVIGVAPDAQLYAIKALGSDGSGYISDMIEGCQWALEEGIPVVNMSLGSTHRSTALQAAMSVAASQGMITVAAVGNDGERGVFFPAGNDVAICVAGSGMDDQRMPWSNYGSSLQENGVAAPGDWILAATKDGGWQRVSGTSIATPHVTGIVALLLEIESVGRESARKFVFEGASQFETPDEFRGHGVVNAEKTLDAMSRRNN